MTAAKTYFKHGDGDDPVIVARDDDVDQLIDALAAESWETPWRRCMSMDV